jgi:hypothetical protein
MNDYEVIESGEVLINALLVDLKSVAKACRSRDYNFPKDLFAFLSAWSGSTVVL